MVNTSSESAILASNARSAAAVKETPPSRWCARSTSSTWSPNAPPASPIPRSPPASRSQSSASYILRALESAGYVRRDRESGKYHLGLAVVASAIAPSPARIREIAQPVLRNWSKSRASAPTSPSSTRPRHVHREDRLHRLVKMNTWIGRRMDLHSTAVGKALSAYLPAETVDNIFKEKN